MKKRILFLSLLFSLLGWNAAEASHIMGVDLTYECINACTIRVHLRGYRDCTGVAGLGNNVVFTGNSPACTTPPAVTAWSPQQTTEVTPICPGFPTRCNNASATINGVEEYYWFRDYDICARPNCIFTLSWSDCCRNPSITSIAAPASQSIYIGSTTLNTGLGGCNSSPQFLTPPVPYVCQGSNYTFNQGAVDPDGDSVSYSLGPCLSSAGVNLPYNGGYSPTAPLGVNWLVTIDPASGDINIAPNPAGPSPGNIQVGVLCVYVTEWRNGVAINTIVRDVQVTVIPCPANQLPTSTPVTNLQGVGTLVGPRTVQICVGNQLCFDILGSDPDVGQGMSMWWSQNLPGATFTSLANPAIQDTIRGQTPGAQFCWTPNTPGTYVFQVTVRDSACPNYGQNQYSFTIQVVSLAGNVQSAVIGCGLAAFCVTPTQGTGPYTFTWTGNGGLTSNPNANDSCLVHTYPGPGTYNYNVIWTDASSGCNGGFSGTVNITNGTLADAGPDITVCAGQPITIGTPATGAPNQTVSWTPAAGLSATNVYQPTVSSVNPGITPIVSSYIVTVTDTLLGCVDSDTVQVTVNPVPVASFAMSPTACVGLPQQITFNGTAGAGATYQWNFGAGATPATATGVGPHSVSWSSAGIKNVSLTVIQAGCTSSVFIGNIQVNPIPTSGIAPVQNQCLTGNSFDFTSTGTYSGAATFQWFFFPGATPATSTQEDPTGIHFNTAGTHYATVQVNDQGCVSTIDTLSFIVHPMPNPVWILTTSGTQCFDGNSYGFQATGNNQPGATYSWTFQDGSPATGTGQTPSTTFTTPGTKAVTLTVSQNGCDSSFTQNIFVFPDPVVDAGPDIAFCAGEGGDTLNATVVNGTSPYYYTWWCNQPVCGLDSINDNDPIANPTTSGWYYVSVVDFNGCPSNVDSAFVTVIPKPIVDAGPDMWICGDSAACVILNPTVSGSPGPFSYQWIPALGLNDPTLLNPCARPDTTTIYTLVATDLGTGCNSALTTIDTLSSMTLHVNPIPIANAGPDRAICLGDTVQLTGTGFGAGPQYDFEWSPASSLNSPTQQNPFAFPTLTTEYILTVWSNNCPSYGDTVLVTVNTNPTVNAGPDQDLCLGGSVLLDAQAGGVAAGTYTYAWTPAAGLSSSTVEDPTASPSQTTMYYVQATSQHGCLSPLDSVLVTVRPTPIAEAGIPLAICNGDSIQLNGTYSWATADSVNNPSVNLFFTWTPATNISSTTAPNPTVWPTQSTWYYFTTGTNLCSHTDSVLVQVLNQISVNLSADTTTLCSGDSVQLSASGGLGNASFTWTPATGLSDPGSANPMAAPAVTTTYTVLAQEGACSDTVSITLDVIPTPSASFLNSLTEGCAPFDVNFQQTATDALLYAWDFGDGSPVSNAANPTHTYTAPGVYPVTLTATNTGGCSDTWTGSSIYVYAPPVAAFSSDPDFPATMYLPQTEVQFTNNSQGSSLVFNWNFGDGIQSNALNPAHVYASEGQYFVTLTVTDNHGCSDDVQHGPYVIITPEVTIPNVFTPNGDGINDIFLPKYTGSQPWVLTLVDRWGVPQFTTRNPMEGWDGLSKGGNEAPDGVYYYTISIGNKDYVGQVTLMR